MGYHLNRLDEPVFIAVSNPLLTKFGIHLRLESCVPEDIAISLKEVYNARGEGKGFFTSYLSFFSKDEMCRKSRISCNE